MNLLVLSIISLIAGASTGVGGILGVLFKPGDRSLVLGLGYSSGIMLGVTFLMLVFGVVRSGVFPVF